MHRNLAVMLLTVPLSYGGTYIVDQAGAVLTAPRSTTAKALLFEVVTNQGGFDTELTISNTSQDTLGSTGQNGTCTLSYYGSTTGGGAAPAPQTTPVIQAGKQIVFTLAAGGSGVAATPGFQGYIFANCQFSLLRGFAKIIHAGGSPAVGEGPDLIATPRSTTPQDVLFPFVTNQGGYDTRVFISNTTQDPFGTTPVAGTCTLHYYGNTTGGGPAPNPQTTTSIPAGTQAIFTLSGGGSNGIAATPGFQGYMIVSCSFPLAIGYSNLIDASGADRMVNVPPEYINPTVARDLTVHPLLFPSVVNQNGVDTQISIANTTSDPYGTTPTNGTCTFTYFGTTSGGGAAPSPQTSNTIQAGQTLVFTLAKGGNHGIVATPGFQGYLIASCTFPLARGHGFTAPPLPAGAGGVNAIQLTIPRATGPSTVLFPAVTTRGGYDTNFTISNTSADPFGTSQGSGACMISYYGDVNGGNPPATQTSSSIAPGGQLTFSLANGNAAQGITGVPGFRGYVIASCAFPQALGLASIEGIVTAGAPFGAFDTPTTGANVSGAIAVTGWALSYSGISGVDVWREPNPGEATSPNGLVFIYNATIVAGTRPDVQALYPAYPGSYQSGWGLQLLTNELPSNSGTGVGNGTYKIHVLAHGNDGQTTDLAVVTIVVNNATAKLPFGTIDTPTQGGTASGSSFVNFGWALTPNPANVIPKDGSTIFVYIDNVAVGHPVYNNPRSDISTLFPGLQNSSGPVGFYMIDTTKLSNGLHSISWSVTDSAGNAQGLGSRYFMVQN